jgi:hypothetical protein
VRIWAYGVLLLPAAGIGSFGVGAESNGASSSFRLVCSDSSNYIFMLLLFILSEICLLLARNGYSCFFYIFS